MTPAHGRGGRDCLYSEAPLDGHRTESDLNQNLFLQKRKVKELVLSELGQLPWPSHCLQLAAMEIESEEAFQKQKRHSCDVGGNKACLRLLTQDLTRCGGPSRQCSLVRIICAFACMQKEENLLTPQLKLNAECVFHEYSKK